MTSPKSCNKDVLVAEVARRCGIRKTRARRAVDAYFRTINKALRQGRLVNLPKFGILRVKTVKVPSGRTFDPGSASVEMVDKRTVKFKTSLTLKRLINAKES